MRPVLFLDIDGVLNSQEYFKTLKGFRTSSSDDCIDPAAVSRLNRITSVSDAAIVVSSSWRVGYMKDLDGLRLMMKRNGIDADVIGITVVDARARGDQIQTWLDEHPETKSFVILDDTDDMGHLKFALVQTTHKQGLQDEHVLPAIFRLKPVVYT